MLYLDDRLPLHPKILKAGQRLGEGGASQALHLYLLGITYARQNLTDGFIPNAFVLSCGVISKSGSVAKVLANRTIRLWRKVPGGYQIHDYHQWNPKASTVKEKREQDRQRKARERGGQKSNVSTMDTSRTRARASSMKPVPTKSTSTDAARRLAFARPKMQDPKTPTFALAVVVMREALDQARTVDHDTGIATAGEYFKTFCARRGLAYDSDLVRRAYDACAVAQRRRA
jgi:hypothetical protein